MTQQEEIIMKLEIKSYIEFNEKVKGFKAKKITGEILFEDNYYIFENGIMNGTRYA
jgi:hypothetical protein